MENGLFKHFCSGVLLLSLACKIAHAQDYSSLPNKNDYQREPATIECVINEAKRYNVPANVLLAIASIENGKNGQYVTNTNKTQDIGHFQINSSHWKPGGYFYGISDFSEEDAAWRGCFNAALAAWILNFQLNSISYSSDYWTRAAAYHSRTQIYNQRYRKNLIIYSIQWGHWLEQNYQTQTSFIGGT